jgi:hypothetical protein
MQNTFFASFASPNRETGCPVALSSKGICIIALRVSSPREFIQENGDFCVKGKSPKSLSKKLCPPSTFLTHWGLRKNFPIPPFMQ